MFVHTIASKCSSGEIANCACVQARSNLRASVQYQRSCENTVGRGQRFAEEFTIPGAKKMRRLTEKSPLKAFYARIQEHNNRAGQKLIEILKDTRCSCENSLVKCAVYKCYKALPKHAQIIQALRALYANATRVVENQQTKQLLTNKGVAPNENELIYSIDLARQCMVGRYCSTEAGKEDNCEKLCCNGKYETKTIWAEEKFNCKFVYCCRVVCETRQLQKDTFVCR